ncbi:Similar to S.cerevisiae protein NBP2 (Protein involved in the HOG (high osmolarity glycerol) pathway) [Malassezia sympodialis ATCC 42132]|uniref:Similar to S.cerevisiae protein NBP2 (Protein involved in the HOG (High osmolarity glycerol) pathway) n=1 Tax=Malassezia sympodialis (strain ATCC 42132) TaxID=1230383 RepID=A0A1M8A7Z8_MALS4|nr:Similar to S.cerevisiae protein NBP2 (Protein involved in the HOG (high osmolarity glycerol) pathway) [Malassezia sympodialis ATCC 42132]
MSTTVPIIDLDAEAIVSSPETTEPTHQQSLSTCSKDLLREKSNDHTQGDYEADLVLSGILGVRDFAFETNDERYYGHGYVIPSKNQETSQSFHCVAIYDFAPEADNELPLQAGIPVEAFPPEKDGWILAKNPEQPDQCGLVPYTYLQPVG